MSITTKIKKQPLVFQRLTGITPAIFDELLSKIAPVNEAENLKRLSRPGRKRKVGGGMQFTLPLEDRLLMLLMYYRTYTTHIFLGLIFGIDGSNVGRNMNPLQPLLARIFRIPERKIEITEEEIIVAFFDGTEQPTNRPKHGQQKWYSGKKKKHTIKHQVVVVRKRKKPGNYRIKQKRKVRIVAVSKPFVGRTHDKKMYEETRTVLPPKVPGKGDTAYIGTALKTPRRKPRGGELTEKQKKSNRRFSSVRVTVEHGIGKMKIWRICRDQYRNLRSKHAVMFKNVAGLHNLMFA